MTIPDHSAPAASDNKPGGVQPSSAGAGGGVGGGGGTSRVQNNMDVSLWQFLGEKIFFGTTILDFSSWETMNDVSYPGIIKTPKKQGPKLG